MVGLSGVGVGAIRILGWGAGVAAAGEVRFSELMTAFSTGSGVVTCPFSSTQEQSAARIAKDSSVTSRLRFRLNIVDFLVSDSLC
jgi:hypothetical protein